LVYAKIEQKLVIFLENFKKPPKFVQFVTVEKNGLEDMRLNIS